MRQFLLERVYALDEGASGFLKHTFIGVDKNGDWFVLDRLVEMDNPTLLRQYRLDMTDVLILGVLEENKPAEFFRDYWSFLCGRNDLSVQEFQDLLVKAKKTQIFGIMPELA